MNLFFNFRLESGRSRKKIPPLGTVFLQSIIIIAVARGSPTHSLLLMELLLFECPIIGSFGLQSICIENNLNDVRYSNTNIIRGICLQTVM